MADADSIALQVQDTPDPEHPTSDDDSGSSDIGEPSMVVSRARRSNAGKDMAKLLALEEAEGVADAEINEMWQEDANDEEFAEADAPDDVSFGSESSDDEGAEDEEQGEKELAAAERAEKSKKRKAHTLMSTKQPLRIKKVRIDPFAEKTAPPRPVGRPRKKSERLSWLPTGDDAPIRTSSRSLAVQSRTKTHENLKEKEKHRLKTIAVMEAAEQRKQASKPKTLSQAERMSQAAEVERQNAKSLNRWEESEKKRVEEQKAKLEALKNRKLEGPVIRYYSGPAVWHRDKIRHVGKGAVLEEIEKQYAEKPKPPEKPADSMPPTGTSPSKEETNKPDTATNGDQAAPSTNGGTAQEPPKDTNPATTYHDGYNNSIMFPPPPSTAGFLDGIEYWASLEHKENTRPPPNPTSEAPKPSSPQQPQKPPPHHPASLAVRNLITLASFAALELSSHGTNTKSQASNKDQLIRLLLEWEDDPRWSKTKTSTPPPSVAPGRKSDKAHKDKDKDGSKDHHVDPCDAFPCVITGKKARYRDPLTGLAYRDRFAFKRVRELAGVALASKVVPPVQGSLGSGEGSWQDVRWSALLGAYVGVRGGRAAAGVPHVFSHKKQPNVQVDVVKVE
ncbi:YL1-domain-containing protein [Aulographum hederae CBS 113979]|uniref:YL1-domain-containing protein n=1 Tax=Aulographum hederae CBS 113979 TaxID=1176131 RepID=A0A6G1H4F8_9PEZI|nr:YL1-domain-containing protein [Aulographum hederae CBS 113979]